MVEQPGDTSIVQSQEQRGAQESTDRGKRGGTGAILLILGIAVGVYAFSPGARHFYKHGQLPPQHR